LRSFFLLNFFIIWHYFFCFFIKHSCISLISKFFSFNSWRSTGHMATCYVSLTSFFFKNSFYPMVTWLVYVCVCVYMYIEKMTWGRIEVYDKLRRATAQRFKSSGNRKDAFNNLGRGLKRLGLILQRTRGYYIPTTALGSNWTTIIS